MRDGVLPWTDAASPYSPLLEEPMQLRQSGFGISNVRNWFGASVVPGAGEGHRAKNIDNLRAMRGRLRRPQAAHAPSAAYPKELAYCTGTAAILLRYLCFGLLVTRAAFAIDPTESLTELNHTQWTARDGAPLDVQTIAQTTDGFLWLGAPSGLYRFDGARFELPSLPTGAPITDAVSSLFALTDNGLLVGMRFGGIFLIRNGHVTHYGAEEGLPRGSVTAFAVRSDGTFWAQTTAGLYHLNGNTWKLVAEDWNYPAKTGYSLIMDRTGTLWSRSAEGTFSLPPNAVSFIRSAIPGGQGVFASCAAGKIWVSDEDQGLMVLADRFRSIPGSALGGGDPAAGSIFCDREGGLWTYLELNARVRLLRIPDVVKFAGDGYEIPPAEQELSKTTQSITAEASISALEDREGTIWLVSRSGLHRFRSNKLHSALESLPMRNPAIAVGKDGDIYLADERALVKIPPAEAAQTVTALVNRNDVISIWSDIDSSFWIGYQHDLEHYVGGRIAKEPALPGPNNLGIHAIVRDNAGDLWAASLGNGLYRLNAGVWTKNGGVDDLPRATPTSLSVDTEGRLWVGYVDERVGVIDHGGVDWLRNLNELPGGAISATYTRGEHVWIALQQGVFLNAHGHFYPLIENSGAAVTGVSGIIESEDGALWLNGNAGLTHVPVSEVNVFVKDPAHHVNAETFDYEDGLNGAVPSLLRLPSIRIGGDGRLWVTTTLGAYWINPKAIQRNTLAPPVAITSVQSGEKRYLAANGAVLPERTANFEIDYTALSLTLPKRIKFKYKLDGVDSDWQNAGNRRQAFYNNIPPGLHVFHVIAANEDGVWNATGTSVGVRIPPAFYQTTWFLALCCLATAGILWQGYRLRLRQLQGRLSERLRDRLNERERIARELHDTLIQSAQGLILIFQGFAGQLPKPDGMRQKMEVALDRADHLLNEARARVMELRTSGIDDDIVQALVRAGKELFADKSVQYSVISSGAPRPVPQPAADEIYRISRECLANAAAHSDAKTVEVQVSFNEAQLELRVRDDGCGISAEILNAGSRPQHFGLQGIRERAERLDAELNLWSREGAGTELQLLIPARVAYRDDAMTGQGVIERCRTWWHRRRTLG